MGQRGRQSQSEERRENNEASIKQGQRQQTQRLWTALQPDLNPLQDLLTFLLLD